MCEYCKHCNIPIGHINLDGFIDQAKIRNLSFGKFNGIAAYSRGRRTSVEIVYKEYRIELHDNGTYSIEYYHDHCT